MSRYDDGRPLKILPFSPEFLLSMLTTTERQTIQVAKNVLPDDARIAGCQYNPMKHRFEMLIESSSYELIPDGGIIPEVKAVVMRTVFKKDA